MGFESFEPYRKNLEERLQKICSKGSVQDKFIMNGGKRLRPILSYIVAEALGFEITDKLLDAMLATELVHNSTLVHDDLMDGDSERRGGKTVHEIYKDKYEDGKGKPYPNFRDEQAANASTEAILDGNIMFTRGLRLLSDYPSAMNDLMRTYEEINEGQKLDIKKDLSKDQYLEMIRLKTAVLFGCSARIGARLVNLGERSVNEISDAIFPAARAFQIQDDILDYATTRGDKQGSDLRNGRRNLITHIFYERATDQQKAKFGSYLGKKELTGEELTKAIKLLEDTKTLDRVKEMRDSLCKESIQKIQQLGFSPKYTGLLSEYAALLALREK